MTDPRRSSMLTLLVMAVFVIALVFSACSSKPKNDERAAVPATAGQSQRDGSSRPLADGGPYQHGYVSDVFDEGWATPVSRVSIDEALASAASGIVLPAPHIVGDAQATFVGDPQLPQAERGINVLYDSGIRLYTQPGSSERQYLESIESGLKAIESTGSYVPVAGKEPTRTLISFAGTKMLVVTPGEEESRVRHARVKISARVSFAKGSIEYRLESRTGDVAALKDAARSILESPAP